ncbi:hypothetical protein BEL05_08880 [Shewanella colwelliana]|uniref:tRNA 5-methylaminomethyl-2-thiouridine biosynthesis bifunctional protein MnmC n=1 Tax=Shewanella colwelliana TaxID=23 RepID=A0A1E5IXN6_SHECO|nr:FAD-dependent 5-carboxymethylaminomethyl-2-thiouridine(34) oxidoreductase MnmC [Shewanella colwelliana]OEG75315.1 hypothetical protein BEL05_08880 [Shewanella colwelliana]
MPNIIVRVNSLTTEREDKTQISVNISEIDSLFSHLTTNTPFGAPIIVGVIGKDHATILKQWLVYHGSSTNQSRWQLKFFIKHVDEITGLCDAISQLTDIATHLQDIRDAKINGCHRISLFDGTLSLDLHIGDTAPQLREIVSQTDIKFKSWLITTPTVTEHLTQTDLWQMAKLSHVSASIVQVTPLDIPQHTYLASMCDLCGFEFIALTGGKAETNKELAKTNATQTLNRELALKERCALLRQQQESLNFNPLTPASSGSIAVIGGGVASACLALSLAERGKSISLFCMDGAPGQQASGNKQGAIYPLLTPEHGTLSHFFLQGYLFSRHRIHSLVSQGYPIDHDFCGVLHTGHDARSRARLQKIIAGQPWAMNIAQAVTTEQADAMAGISIDEAGIYYPLGGWVCPHQLTQAALDNASSITDNKLYFNTQVTAIEQLNDKWFLTAVANGNTTRFGPFDNVVLANGRHLTDFPQTRELPISGFRGQVSHIPSRGALSQLNTVLCSHGYLTPNHQGLHCTGASYVKDAPNNEYSHTEQFENLDKIRQSYQGDWTKEIDITGHSARVGVRMVTRDHAPMVGCAPNYDAIMAAYQTHQHTKESIDYWVKTPAPTHKGLFILGGLGSRGLTSGPLSAEILAAQMCGELLPTTTDILTLLNPNRMWLRKLLKGKALI